MPFRQVMLGGDPKFSMTVDIENEKKQITHLTVCANGCPNLNLRASSIVFDVKDLPQSSSQILDQQRL